MSYFYAIPITPPAPASTIPKAAAGGGTYFPRYINRTLLRQQLYSNFVGVPNPPLSSFFLYPNEYDICLSREYSLYEQIDRTIHVCKRPDCFLLPESSWEDMPPGFREFNPVGAVPLPDPSTPETVIFSFRCPIGYDGLILAQFNNFTQPWTEGSGDLIWRVRCDGRYLTDCGSILYTIGSNVQLSPVFGGLQLRSGNLVEYLVYAPNTSGSLPFPGQGNVIAGLHGYFYPRK